jgi:hypothetical protein
MGICQPDPLLNDHFRERERERERERAVFVGMWSAKKLWFLVCDVFGAGKCLLEREQLVC